MESPQNSSNLREKAVKSVIWTAIESWGRQAISLVVFFILARLLSPENFGLIALAYIFIEFVQIFVDQGFSVAIIQRQEIDAEHLDTAFWTTLGISILLTVLSIAGAGLVADLFKQPQLIPIIQCLSISFTLSGLSSVQQAVLERRFAFKSLAIRSLLAVIIGGIVGVVMAFFNFGVWSLVGQQISSSLVQVLVLWRVSDWRPGFKFSVIHAKELFTFGINISAFNIINFFNRRSDDLLIGYFLGLVALGYYSVAYKLLQVMMQVLITTTTKVALPIFSRLQGEPERLLNAFYSATQFTSLLVFPVFLCVPVLAPEFIKVFFGEQWIQSIPVLQVLSLIGPVHLIFFYNNSVILALGKPSWRLWIQVINTVTNVVGFALAVKWGIVAVASAYVVRGYLILPISLLAINKLVKMSLINYLRLYIVPFVASGVMIGTILVTKYFLGKFIEAWMLLIISLLLGISIYIFVLSVISPKLFRQLLDLAKTLNIKIKKKA
ncbi:lipopolysaccharide biosynthesis protein [Nostoc edaphicum CCNP1411]|uniref:Lipopolysaccharide biosynthesis protein n=1 Tax=Nostoc edaphicum CCNP1411 TaxID=1472755 RepID=A0A7D7LHV9_9NOSO|nr:lipopolysaccharide biosynthesis protein [Nostoc edaphicum]QMS91172.1 lipopolysaccharide biosynthesis protein [Nostoc edaphicum CCNP1411]